MVNTPEKSNSEGDDQERKHLDPSLERALKQAREIIRSSDPVRAANVISADTVLRLENALKEAGCKNIDLETLDPDGQAVFLSGSARHPALTSHTEFDILPPVQLDAGLGMVRRNEGGTEYQYDLTLDLSAEQAKKLRQFCLELDPSHCRINLVDERKMSGKKIDGTPPTKYCLILSFPCESLEETRYLEEVIHMLKKELLSLQ